MKNSARTTTLRAGIVIFIAMMAYIPAMKAGFIWDDDSYLTENSALRSVEGLSRIWLEPRSMPQYYPLVFTTFWLEYHLWGLRPEGYHLVNVLLHLLSALILWRLLERLKVPGAWFAALLFALHPVNVESVAWVTERKNVLSGACYFGSALCLFRFFGLGNEVADQCRKWLWYTAGFLLFACALMSKTVACSLPAAMVLILWWQRGRVTRKEIAALMPFFILGLGLGLLTVWLERHSVGAQGPEWELSFLERCLLAGRALWFYAGKVAWPTELSFNYPRWQIASSTWWHYLYPGGVAVVLSLLWTLRGRIGRGPLVGALLFCGTLFPALGFFDVYPFRYSYVADHFQYLATPGLLALTVALFVRITSRLQTSRQRPIRIALGLACFVLLAAQTWRQGCVYASAEVLWRDTIEKNPASWLAHNNLGIILNRENKSAEAVHHFLEALRHKPDNAKAHSNLATALREQGKVQEAISHCLEAIRIQPNYAEAHYNLGVILAEQGNLSKAIDYYREALQLNPGYAEAHTNLGTVLVAQGKVREAITQYRTALRLRPDWAPLLNNLAWILATHPDPKFRNGTEALQLAQKACEQSGHQKAEFLDTLAAAYAAAARFPDAVSTAQRAFIMALAAGQTHLAREIEQHLHVYRAGKPFIETEVVIAELDT